MRPITFCLWWSVWSFQYRNIWLAVIWCLQLWSVVFSTCKNDVFVPFSPSFAGGKRLSPAKDVFWVNKRTALNPRVSTCSVDVLLRACYLQQRPIFPIIIIRIAVILGLRVGVGKKASKIEQPSVSCPSCSSNTCLLSKVCPQCPICHADYLYNITIRLIFLNLTDY